MGEKGGKWRRQIVRDFRKLSQFWRGEESLLRQKMGFMSLTDLTNHPDMIQLKATRNDIEQIVLEDGDFKKRFREDATHMQESHPDTCLRWNYRVCLRLELLWVALVVSAIMDGNAWVACIYTWPN